MLKKIFLSLVVLFSLCISVCAESISYDKVQKTINNTGSFAIVKKDGDLYFSGQGNSIKDIELVKGDVITFLKWNSYADIKPLTESTDYTVCEIKFTCEGQEIETRLAFEGCEIQYPAAPEKTGYKVKWNLYEKGGNNFVAEAEYVLIDYKVLFVADGKTQAETTYNVKNLSITEPTVPKKEGYNGRWEEYELSYGDVTVNAVYTPIEYTATFESEGAVVAQKTFNAENMNIEEPEVPAKEGYTGKWEDYILSLNNITVKAVYEIVQYEVSFVADDIVKIEKYTIKNKKVTEPAVPEITGYTGKWESYELNLENITVKALYTPIEYKAVFKAENFEETKIFTIVNMSVTPPPAPEKTGYTGKWEKYELSLADITVNAVYTPNSYKITFDASDEEIAVTYDSKYPELPVPVNTDVSKPLSAGMLEMFQLQRATE